VARLFAVINAVVAVIAVAVADCSSGVVKTTMIDRSYIQGSKGFG